MPDNSQGRIDNMPPAKKNSHKLITTIVLLGLIVGIILLIGLS